MVGLSLEEAPPARDAVARLLKAAKALIADAQVAAISAETRLAGYSAIRCSPT